jgi:transposase-like protein
MAEQIITMLRETRVCHAQGASIAEVCKRVQIADQTYCRWRK